jgi:hypothetical protein
MKGRMYDPIAGRFMSPDPILQAPFMSQGLNRYSYVFNDPVNNVDPSGFAVVDWSDQRTGATAVFGGWAVALTLASAAGPLGIGVGALSLGSTGLIRSLSGGGGSSLPGTYGGVAPSAAPASSVGAGSLHAVAQNQGIKGAYRPQLFRTERAAATAALKRANALSKEYDWEFIGVIAKIDLPEGTRYYYTTPLTEHSRDTTHLSQVLNRRLRIGKSSTVAWYHTHGAASGKPDADEHFSGADMGVTDWAAGRVGHTVKAYLATPSDRYLLADPETSSVVQMAGETDVLTGDFFWSGLAGGK